MFRFFFILLLSVFLRASIADSECPNATSPILSSDGIKLKLQMELDLLRSSDEVQRRRPEAISSSSPRYPSSCAEETSAKSQSGIHAIRVPSFSALAFLVYCNAEEQGGGWTVIQRRVDDSIDFYRDWASYKVGFGNMEENFFIGLDKLHALTYAAPQELLIILTDFENITKYAKYDSFAIGGETESYALNVLGKYSGDAGDSFTIQQGMKFSTKDNRNDLYTTSCAVMYQGAWWYRACHLSNLNGLYLGGAYPEDKIGQGINWDTWHGHYYSLKTVNMMIRPKRN